jgi:hypothetical protein
MLQLGDFVLPNMCVGVTQWSATIGTVWPTRSDMTSPSFQVCGAQTVIARREKRVMLFNNRGLLFTGGGKPDVDVRAAEKKVANVPVPRFGKPRRVGD